MLRGVLFATRTLRLASSKFICAVPQLQYAEASSKVTLDISSKVAKKAPKAELKTVAKTSDVKSKASKAVATSQKAKRMASLENESEEDGDTSAGDILSTKSKSKPKKIAIKSEGDSSKKDDRADVSKKESKAKKPTVAKTKKTGVSKKVEASKKQELSGESHTDVIDFSEEDSEHLDNNELTLSKTQIKKSKATKPVEDSEAFSEFPKQNHIESEVSEKTNIKSAELNTTKGTINPSDSDKETSLIDVNVSNNNCETSSDEDRLTRLKSFPLYILQEKDTGDIYKSSTWEFSPVLENIQKLLPKEPSVTKILSETMPEESRLALERWEKRMIAQLGWKGFQKMKQEMFVNGKNFHSCLAEHFQHGTDISDLDLNSANQGLWDSVSPILDHISNVRLVETTVRHPLLGYMGIFDCLASYRGRPVLIDWKTSDRVKFKLEMAYDDPVQLAAYLGALKHSADFDIKVNEALLVVCYRNGRQANVLTMPPRHCSHYWEIWLQRLHTFYKSKLEQASVEANS